MKGDYVDFGWWGGGGVFFLWEIWFCKVGVMMFDELVGLIGFVFWLVILGFFFVIVCKEWKLGDVWRYWVRLFVCMVFCLFLFFIGF